MPTILDPPPVLETSSDADAVGLLMQSTLDAVRQVYDAAEIDLPERQYTYVGEVATDCEQVTVELVQLVLGLPGVPLAAAQKCNSMRSAMLAVKVLRQAPAMGVRGQPPSAQDLNSAAIYVARDTWLLMSIPGLVDTLNNGVLADITPISDAGGYIGAQLNFTVTVP